MAYCKIIYLVSIVTFAFCNVVTASNIELSVKFENSSVIELPVTTPAIEVSLLSSWFDSDASSIGFAHNYSKAKLTLVAEISSGDESKWSHFDLKVGISNAPSGSTLDNGSSINIITNGALQDSGAWTIVSQIAKDDYRGGIGNQSPVALTYSAKAHPGALSGTRAITITYTINEDS